MEPVQYLKALRRRWAVIVAAALLALAAGFLTAATASSPETSSDSATSAFQATTVLLPTAGVGGGSSTIMNGTTVAALVTLPAVADRAGQQLKFKGDTRSLAGAVTATTNKDTGLISITATSPKADRAVAVANAFASSLVAFVNKTQSATSSEQARVIAGEIGKLQKELATLQAKAAAAQGLEADLLKLQVEAKTQLLQGLGSQYQDAIIQGSAGGAPIVVQSAIATPIQASSSSFQAPKTRTTRALLAGALGLLAGVALALGLERIDDRIRTKADAESRFGLPVLAEIPVLSRWQRRSGKVNPGSSYADAFRLLGAAMTRPVEQQSRGSTGQAAGSSTHRRAPSLVGDRRLLGEHFGGPVSDYQGTILVTSAGPDEGKTSVAASLAQVFAESGKRVLVLGCDFRRPRIHEALGVPNEWGMAEALAEWNGGRRVLNGHVRPTKCEGLFVVPSGKGPSNPAELMASLAMHRALEDARREADVVIIDTSPILTDPDPAHLLPEVDAVLVVARAGKTSGEVAERTSEVLSRLAAPVAGIVLTGAKETVLPGRKRYGRANGGFPRLVRHQSDG